MKLASVILFESTSSPLLNDCFRDCIFDVATLMQGPAKTDFQKQSSTKLPRQPTFFQIKREKKSTTEKQSVRVIQINIRDVVQIYSFHNEP